MDMAERKKLAFAFLFDTSFGTLWWADNELWKQESAFVLKPEQEGNRHPGVSLRKDSSPDCAIVPLLLGRSRKMPKSRAVVLKMNEATERKSYFGTLKPIHMSYLSFLDGSIQRNKIKPMLTAEEKRELYKFLERRLSWFTK